MIGHHDSRIADQDSRYPLSHVDLVDGDTTRRGPSGHVFVGHGPGEHCRDCGVTWSAYAYSVLGDGAIATCSAR